MASPQEVIEFSIRHPADSTEESRRAASTHVLRALAAHQYAFVRRRTPVSEMDDGQCPHCKIESVHTDHGEVYTDALLRMAAMQAKMEDYREALRKIAMGVENPQEIALLAGA